MARRSSPSPPISARARRSSRRGARRSCSASSPRTSSSTTCARSSSATTSSRCSARTRVYEGQYLLGTSIARPLIAKRQIEIARQVGADAVCHGATGKGNDQVRFELGYYALEPDIQRHRPLARMGVRQPRAADRLRREAPDPDHARTSAARRPSRSTPTCSTPPPRGRCSRTRRSRRPNMSTSAPSRPRTRRTRRRSSRSTSSAAIPSRSTARRCRPPTLLARLNQLGHDNGIGRLDLVENRFVGMKSRGVYETPGGTILLAAHRGIESHHARRRRRCTSRTSHAALREAHLQRLLVRARARDAAGADRQEPGACHRQGPDEALQGQCDRDRPREPARRSTTRTWSPSRKARPATTSATRPASSG